ncbi:MAG: outer membrane lipoprotein carrier protein LolA [Treponema sp.]|nr:outer membrane lipoprotein carrier protein LolA [Treponema sp.]
MTIKKFFSFKKILAAGFALSMAAFAFAQEKNQAFDQVCQNIASHKITKGDFNQTKMIKKINRQIKSSGTFIVAVDEGILWNTKKPFASSMAITKSGIVQTSAQGKKSTVASGSNGTFEQVSSLMTSLFNGNIQALYSNFDIDFTGTKDNWKVNLSPKDSSIKSFISSIEMAGKASIDSMVLNEAGGDYTKYEFLNQVFPDSLSEEEKALFKS